jgi:hypothetical protein
MMRKHTRQEMMKASLWMHRSEYKKIAALSGDMSMNSYLMTIIRNAIAAEQKKNRQDHEKGVEGPGSTKTLGHHTANSYSTKPPTRRFSQ